MPTSTLSSLFLSNKEAPCGLWSVALALWIQLLSFLLPLALSFPKQSGPHRLAQGFSVKRSQPSPHLCRDLREGIKLITGLGFIFLTENNYTLATKIELLCLALFIAPKGKKKSVSMRLGSVIMEELEDVC